MPPHPLSRTIAHHLVCYPLLLAEIAYTPAPSLHKTASGGDKQLKYLPDCLGIQPFQLEVSQVAALSCTTMIGM